MAGSIEPQAKGRGKKPLTAELNLVPYIDLLTCMVAFLLITAVWTQLAAIEVAQRTPGKNGENSAEPPATRITVFVHQQGFSVAVNDEQQPLPAGTAAELDYPRLGDEMARLKKLFPDKTDVQVASADDIRFEAIVRTMDAIRGAGFPDLALVEAGGAGI